MLIYFQPVLQNDLFTIFHAALKDGGYLFLGKSEAIGAFTDAFPIMDAAAKIFGHCSDVKIPGQKTIPYLQNIYLEDDFSDEYDNRYTRRGPAVNEEDEAQEAIDTSLLEQFMPACLVIDEKNDIIHTYGESANFIHMPAGRITTNIFDLITEGLKIPASTLLKKAKESGCKEQYKDISIHGEREDVTLTLTAMPVSRTSGEEEALYALVFAEKAQCGEMPDAESYEIDRVASQHITDLEQDLSDVQGKLNRSIAEQECVNEELQAANEELLTANEELQSSNEELQSVNEELYTVNSEYQQKLTELADLNDDIANFLSSTLTGIIFVDNRLNIRRYTDYVMTEFSVMDHDIGRSLKFISYHFPTVDITEICENVSKTLVPDEREITTSRNKVFFMRVAPYRSMENKILGCVITLIDITTQKQGQIKLHNTEEKLSIAEGEVEAKSDYLSKISHEIRTPMGALVGLIRMAKQQVGDGEELQKNLDSIEKTIEYMAAIVTDISEASRMERDAIEQVREPFALQEVVDNIITLIDGRAKEARLQFEVTIADDFAPHYIGNQTSIQQILINFLNNSIKYSPEGGAISLKIYEDKEADVKENYAKLCFVITDTGNGIKKEFMPELFNEFTREEKDDKNAAVSMGLGLSIAKKLIQSMDGEITVESEVGRGSTFNIYLMLEKYDKPKENIERIEKNQEINLEGHHVLVAEDNDLNRTILGALLANEKITYDEAENGEIALQKFMVSPVGTYDCILMDMRMPVMNGIQATIAIRNSDKEDAKTIPIIAVSANGFGEDVAKARQAGVDEYTTKPIDRDRLFASLSRLLK